jgi:hypothetical protein
MANTPADDVPDLLRSLLSDDESVRDDAWEHLYGNVWHQGTVYEATAYVVPFMLKMLVYDGPPGKSALLHFLLAVAEGSSYLAAHARSDDDQGRWRDILARQGRDLETERQKELSWVEAANRALGEGIPVYFALLDDEDAEIRRLSLGVLASLRGRTAEIVPHLQALLPTVVDAEMVRALHELMDDGPEAQGFFADLMGGGESEKITFIAAVALTARAGEQTPEAAVAILLDALQELGKIRRSEFGFADEKAAWEWGDLRFAVNALTHLGQARAVTT